jgi:dTDP-4-amino-4,6-dideoxygalactose transaminase
MIPIARPMIGADEQAAVHRVLASGQLIQGELVAEFERRFAELCRVREAIAVSSGTAALHLALLAHGIGLGDEVITTAFSFAATANVLLLVGATPVFVDIEPDTYNIDPAQVEIALTPRTKAILPVHLYGNPADMKRLECLARTNNLAIIEDACQAHAAKIDGKPVGGFGTACFSFYATKNMTTGEGGMVTTNNPAIAQRVRLMRSHGQQARYYHTDIGYNLRMTEIQAAIGLVQLEKLEQFTERRIANAHFLTEHLDGSLQVPIARPGHRHVYHQYTVRVPRNRDEWVTQLQARGIGTSIHYPTPIYKQPFYQGLDTRFRVLSADRNSYLDGATSRAQLPETEKAAEQVLSLPVHPALCEQELSTIVKEVRALCL